MPPATATPALNSDHFLDARLAHLDEPQLFGASAPPEFQFSVLMSAGEHNIFRGLHVVHATAFARDATAAEGAQRSAAEAVARVEHLAQASAGDTPEAEAHRAAEQALAAARTALAAAEQALVDGRRAVERGGFSGAWARAIGKLHDEREAAKKQLATREAEVKEAREAFDRVRRAIRSGLAAARAADLTPRRDALRAKATEALAEWGAELLAIDALAKALAE